MLHGAGRGEQHNNSLVSHQSCKRVLLLKGEDVCCSIVAAQALAGAQQSAAARQQQIKDIESATKRCRCGCGCSSTWQYDTVYEAPPIVAHTASNDGLVL